MSVWMRADPTLDTVTIHVNGRRVAARPDETVATVLLRLGTRSFGTNPVTGQPQSPACLMGVCFGCLCLIDGRPGTQACLEPVREGLSVETGGPEVA
jgi:aerobic-type carbon monoxide dehydrogenase small subunit (CoxS/CutS family)